MAIEFENEKLTDEQLLQMLHPLLADWFKNTFGSFTEPQRYAIKNICYLQNTLISAPTGTGKTLSAFAAVLSELITLSERKELEDKVYCIYCSPLKALSRDIERNLNSPLHDIKEAAKKFGKNINIRVAVRTGDTSASERSSMLKKPPHILITTPESLAIVLNAPKFREYIREAKWLIVDEIHALAENKRGVHLSLTMERIQRLNPKICRIGLSATIAPIEEIAKFLVGYEGKELRSCKIVDVSFPKGLDIAVISPLKDLVNVTQEEISEKLYSKLDELIQQHKTTLVFTNTRSATERVVNHLKEKFPGRYEGLIGAHHSSVSKEKRLSIEERLKQGKLKAVVCSTSLELGIDIGYIDLVVLLGSPKSISRTLQRIGRSGHRLHDVIKGRILVLDRDDLVECTILAKCAKERKLDKISIPKNCLDVLAQHIFGIAIEDRIHVNELFELVRNSYCYKDLDRKDFNDVISYLAGEYSSLETRHVYGKIWYDKETGYIGRKGKTARVIYMTNIGTIPDEAKVKVKLGDVTIGYLDEAFLERMHKGDVFTLGGEKYMFLYSRGMTIQVKSAEKIPPTIPSWISEMLPLSFDSALEIQRFRKLIAEKFDFKRNKDEIIDFIKDYVKCDNFLAETIYNYFYQQYKYAKIPHTNLLLIEQVKDDEGNHLVFHTLFGRRVNDALSRALAWVMSKLTSADITLSINDNGFVISSKGKLPLENSWNVFVKSDLEITLKQAIEDSELLKRRFRHCATRALMILRQYKGYEKSVAKQQSSSSMLLNAVKRIDPDFCILREARREVMQDAMDIEGAKKVLEWIRTGTIKVEKIDLPYPSPFAFNIFAMGRSDLVKIDSRLDFIRRMHEKVMQKISS
ncbi:MAG: ATP-dependent helicase [Candidatus Diapherotrites archaeon]